MPLPDEILVLAPICALFLGMFWSFLMMRKGSTRAKDLLVEEARTEGTAAHALFEDLTDRAAEKCLAKLPKMLTAKEITAELELPTAESLTDQLVEVDGSLDLLIKDRMNTAVETVGDNVQAKIEWLKDQIQPMIDDSVRRFQKGRELNDGKDRANADRGADGLGFTAVLAKLQQDDPASYKLYTGTIATIKATGRLRDLPPREIRDQIAAVDELVLSGADLKEAAKAWGLKVDGNGARGGSSGYNPG